MTSLRTRIADDPWDASAWLELAHDMSQRDPTVPANLEEQRAFYDDMLARFPTAVRLCPWLRLAQTTPYIAPSTMEPLRLWQAYLQVSCIHHFLPCI